MIGPGHRSVATLLPGILNPYERASSMNRLHRMSIFVLIGFIGAASFVAWKSRHGVHIMRGSARGGVGASNTQVPQRHGSHTDSPLVTGSVRLEEQPIVGATVEVLDLPDHSVTTGRGGDFSFSLPVGSTQTLRVSHPGHWTTQSTLVVGATNFDFNSIDEAKRVGLYPALGLTEDRATGVIVVHFEPTHGRGYGARLSVAGGTRFVLTSSGPQRQDTTAHALHENMLGFANVPTGVVTVTPIPPHGTCSPVFGTATVRVDPRIVTAVQFHCT